MRIRTVLLLAVVVLGLSFPAAASQITIDFEHLPDSTGALTIPTSTTYLQSLDNQWTSVGVTFTGTLLYDNFFNGVANNHFISTTYISGTFSVPAYMMFIDTYSCWPTDLTAYDAAGNILAISGYNQTGFALRTLGFSTDIPFVRFTLTTPNPGNIMNADNLFFSTDAPAPQTPVPEPTSLLLLGSGLAVAYKARRKR